MTTLSGIYRNRKIYLKDRIKLKDDEKVKVNIIAEGGFDKYFGVMKNKIKENSVKYINKLREPRF